MAKKNKKNHSSSIIAQNKRARHEYEIFDPIEAGIELYGWEVKSIREGKVSLLNPHVIFKNNEAYLIGLNVRSRSKNILYKQDERVRKLLIHKDQINKLCGLSQQQGYTVVALDLRWKPRGKCYRGLIKVYIALAKGKKMYDKRQDLKEREWQRTKSRILKSQMR